MKLDDEHLSLTQKAPASATNSSTSKAYRKRPRPSPGTWASKKLFKDNYDGTADGRFVQVKKEKSHRVHICEKICSHDIRSTEIACYREILKITYKLHAVVLFFALHSFSALLYTKQGNISFFKLFSQPASKFSKGKEVSQLLADIIYRDLVVVKVFGAGNPTTTKISSMINTVCNCEVDDFTLLPFWRRMYIVIFMGPDKQEEKSEKALKQESFTYQTTKLEFEPFKMNFHSTVNPLCQRVILALEAWNKEGIAELLDNCCKIEGLYVEHHIEDLSFFRLAAWTTNCDLIPKLIDWNIDIIEENQQTLISIGSKTHIHLRY
uniref:Uncharacterized protein n=1 Tax=Oryza glaberrima TaxID=4538 RepID=I1PUP2_ORYGL